MYHSGPTDIDLEDITMTKTTPIINTNNLFATTSTTTHRTKEQVSPDIGMCTLFTAHPRNFLITIVLY